jgi:hypothetical protein
MQVVWRRCVIRMEIPSGWPPERSDIAPYSRTSIVASLAMMWCKRSVLVLIAGPNGWWACQCPRPVFTKCRCMLAAEFAPDVVPDDDSRAVSRVTVLTASYRLPAEVGAQHPQYAVGAHEPLRLSPHAEDLSGEHLSSHCSSLPHALRAPGR